MEIMKKDEDIKNLKIWRISKFENMKPSQY